MADAEENVSKELKMNQNIFAILVSAIVILSSIVTYRDSINVRTARVGHTELIPMSEWPVLAQN